MSSKCGGAHNHQIFSLLCTEFCEVLGQQRVHHDILDPFIFPFADLHYEELHFIFQQGLASAQTAKSTNFLFGAQGIFVMDWAANSPD